MAFSLRTTAFNNGQSIPDIYTCSGKDNIPHLSWSDPPKGTQSFAIIMDDPDATAGIWVHWVVFNIPANLNQWPSEQANVAASVVNASNSWGQTGYRGPCPPVGKNHRYLFTLYALDTSLDLSTKAGAAEVYQAMQGHILATTELMGTYQRS